MSAIERAALADAVRDMRRAGIQPRDMVSSGAPRRVVSALPRSLLRPRLAAKAVRS